MSDSSLLIRLLAVIWTVATTRTSWRGESKCEVTLRSGTAAMAPPGRFGERARARAHYIAHFQRGGSHAKGIHACVHVHVHVGEYQLYVCVCGKCATNTRSSG